MPAASTRTRIAMKELGFQPQLAPLSSGRRIEPSRECEVHYLFILLPLAKSISEKGRTPIARDIRRSFRWNSNEDRARRNIGIDHRLRSNNCTFSYSNSRKEKSISSNTRTFLHRRADELERFLRNVLVICENAAGTKEN